jgi:anti-sigma regulatory factor (Ser/Thr protein kinase)
MSEHGVWAFTIQLQTDPHVIRAVRKVIAATARIGGARDADARLIELSVGEALANARLHAYQSGVGPIEATVTMDGEMFSVEIQNAGKPVTGGPRVPDTLDPPESQRWGLYLLGRIMDEVEITRSKLDDRGTAIRMAKRLTASPRGDPGVEEAGTDPLNGSPESGIGVMGRCEVA